MAGLDQPALSVITKYNN